MASSSTSSPTEYEVFLSFRGEDTRHSFTGHLYNALCGENIHAFIDEYSLRPGEEIAPALSRAIERSRISIIIFSENYAFSTWCLDELAKIMECKKKMQRIVVPVFYHIDPSDVRNQSGSYGWAFAKHEERFNQFKVQKWRTVLQEAANLAGWNSSNGLESTLMRQIVEDILNTLIKLRTNFSISIYPLRYDTFHLYLSRFLKVGLNDVLMVGICGEKGTGKTAIAKAVYDQISYTFEGSSFLENVGPDARKPNGIAQLQGKLLSDTLLEEDVKVVNAIIGMGIIKEKLGFKRVFIVLDNVDDLEQLFALVGNRSWFGLGSKIIITTRNLHLLNVLGVDQVFHAQGLPLPSNIQNIWKKLQQSDHIVAGLQDYINLLHHQTNDRERYLQQRVLEERQKNAFQNQVIADLKKAQSWGLIKDS